VNESKSPGWNRAVEVGLGVLPGISPRASRNHNCFNNVQSR